MQSIKASPSLTAYNFGGLFIITGAALIFALFCSETPVGRRLVTVGTSYGHKCVSFLSFRSNGESRVHSMVHPDPNGDSSSEEEVRGSNRFNVNGLSGPGIDNKSGQSHLTAPPRDGQANETVESDSIQEVQLTDQTNTDASARQTGL